MTRPCRTLDRFADRASKLRHAIDTKGPTYCCPHKNFKVGSKANLNHTSSPLRFQLSVILHHIHVWYKCPIWGSNCNDLSLLRENLQASLARMRNKSAKEWGQTPLSITGSEILRQMVFLPEGHWRMQDAGCQGAWGLELYPSPETACVSWPLDLSLLEQGSHCMLGPLRSPAQMTMPACILELIRSVPFSVILNQQLCLAFVFMEIPS